MYRDIPRDLLEAVEPVVGDCGCELVDLEVTGGSSRSSVVRVTVDTLAGDGRVSIELCARISREVAAQLDAMDTDGHGAIHGSYNLEVSSPGLDRVLARDKDFAAACGKEVKVKTRRPVGGRRRFKGRLVDFREREGTLVLQVDGRSYEIPIRDVERANSIYQFTRDDFSSAKLGSPQREEREAREKSSSGTS